MLKIVQIGTGGFTNLVHGPMLQRYAKENPGEIELAAVCVRTRVDRAEDYCREYGFSRVYTDIEEMMNKEKPDACWSLTNTPDTRNVAGRIMELGIPVLMEKPPGKNLRETMELAEISRKTGTPNMVALNRRFAPCTQRALEWTKDRGPFERLSAQMLRTGRKVSDFAISTGIHALDCVVMLADACFGGLKFAQVRRVQALAGEYNFHVTLTFGSGATGRCDLMPNSGVSDETCTLYGNNKCITFSMPWFGVESKAELWESGKLVDSMSWPTEPEFRDFGVYSFGIYQESAAFIAAIRDGKKPHPSVEETVESVALTAAVAEGVEWQSESASAE
jgi:myo-inositol 2-dehydrogenase / D-chiro-inositol 1-dehydrogenase